MRWFWIDKFVAFESGSCASAIKNVTLAEDVLHDHLPGLPVLPPALMIEGMAQTAGILVGEARGFRENVILAKIRNATFECYATPGDQVRYDTRIESLDEKAAITSGKVSINDQPAGTVDLIFSHVNQADKNLDLPDHNFVFTQDFMTLLKTFQAEDHARSAPA